MSAAVRLIEEALAEKETEIQAKVGDLVTERDTLVADLKKLKRGTKAPGEAPATSDEDLTAAVAHCAKSGPAKTPDIAKFLEVDARTIARRLSKLAGDEGSVISGDKESGYSA